MAVHMANCDATTAHGVVDVTRSEGDQDQRSMKRGTCRSLCKCFVSCPVPGECAAVLVVHGGSLEPNHFDGPRSVALRANGRDGLGQCKVRSLIRGTA